jgi:GNAT superfamily N-acetyltransferase
MQILVIRKAKEEELPKLLEVYTFLHDNPFPMIDSRIEKIWSRIMSDEKQHILLGHVNDVLVSSCVINIIENLTHEQRPYAVIENVVTHPAYRKRGYASQLLSAAKSIAVNNNCYKIMLMTGSKKKSTHTFYRQAGYNSNDKKAFVQWL